MNRPNAWIGSAVARVEDERFLRGRGCFVGDIAAEGLRHAAILRSPLAHGRIERIDTAAALALPGVVAVITASDIGAVPRIPMRQHAVPEGEIYRQPVIAHDKVRYVGEPVAVVIAEDPAVAEDALALIELDITELPVVADRHIAARDDVLMFEEAGTNRVRVLCARMGDADAAFAAADYCRRESFSVQRHTAMPMEPRGLLAEWDAAANRLTLHGATKVIFYNRRTLAEMLGVAETAVDLIEVDVGGGFGARGELYPEDFLIPFAARHVGGRVRWIEDRREHLMAMNHAREMYADIEIACRRDGTVLGLRGHVDVDLGAYVRTNGFTAPRNVVQFMSGPYHVPNIELDAVVYVTNKTPTGTYRGPGRFEASFFGERLFDMAAQDLGIDPAEFRRRNLLREEQLPYPLPALLDTDDGGKTECDNGAYAIVLDRCLREFGWSEKIKLQGRLIDGRYHGVGLGCFIEGGAGGPRENARMIVEPDGRIAVYVGSSAIGQGLETILGQIAADALGLPMDRVRVAHGSTTLVSDGFGSFHSRSTVMGGSAVLLAAEALLAAIRDAAAARFGCAVNDVRFADGLASHGSEQVAFGAFAGLSVERTYHNKKHTYSYGSHAAHVAVDAGTGHVEILDYVTVEDVGRIINPATLHGQVLGAVVQGLGSVFLEHLQYDENGQLLTGSLADYLLPTATDFPRIRGLSLGLRPCPNNPLGAKGAGEGGLIAVGGVIGNAIAGALRSFGVQPRDLPLSPPRLWHLIDQARRAAANDTRNGHNG
ncbi:MAG TPA: xanthine dehydrogenase family protein molybdopterin-binding subunit [Pseudolabrys sp.]|jgi:carbon-monoxide dehydrogenase large subunit|nr:xanthine dehydrogenase family protein molybdopterin-binding subunit [Pseudolabrys sp.]